MVPTSLTPIFRRLQGCIALVEQGIRTLPDKLGIVTVLVHQQIGRAPPNEASIEAAAA